MGGGALALLAAQTVIATENAWRPAAPEGASVIVHADTLHVEMAEAQQVRAQDLRAAGVVHHVVPEMPGESAEALARVVVAEIATSLAGRAARYLPAS